MRIRFGGFQGPAFHWLAAAVWCGVMGFARPVSAQFLGNVGGVCIDAQGMLRETRVLSADERLALIQQEAVGEPVSGAIANGATLRAISLRQLEEAVLKLHQTKEVLPPDLEHLAG